MASMSLDNCSSGFTGVSYWAGRAGIVPFAL